MLKSRAPQLIGDLLVMHKPTLTPSAGNELSGQIRVYGNTVIWSSGLPVVDDSGIRSERYTTYTQGGAPAVRKIRNLEGNWIAPTNYPLVPNTAGEVEGSNAYDSSRRGCAGDNSETTLEASICDQTLAIQG